MNSLSMCQYIYHYPLLCTMQHCHFITTDLVISSSPALSSIHHFWSGQLIATVFQLLVPTTHHCALSFSYTDNYYHVHLCVVLGSPSASLVTHFPYVHTIPTHNHLHLGMSPSQMVFIFILSHRPSVSIQCFSSQTPSCSTTSSLEKDKDSGHLRQEVHRALVIRKGEHTGHDKTGPLWDMMGWCRTSSVLNT